MELTTLSFKVETTEIKQAVDDLNNLSSALKGVNADALGSEFQNVSKKASDASKEIDEATRSTKKISQAADEATPALSKVAKMIQYQSDVLKYLRNDQKFAEDGFTRSQAGLMATATAAGATVDELKTLASIFKDISKVTGKNPFDQSASGLGQLKQQAMEMANASNYLAKGLNLTVDQVRLLTRDQIRLTDAMKQQGASAEEISNDLNRLESEYLQVAAGVNKYRAEAKELENQSKRQAKQLAEEITMMDQAVAQYRKLEEQKAEASRRAAQKIIDANQAAIQSVERLAQISQMMQGGMSRSEATKRVDLSASGVELANIEKLIAAERQLASMNDTLSGTTVKKSSAMSESAKASAWLERELSRAENAVSELNEELRVSTSNRLFKFQEMLEKSGMSAGEASRMMDRYREVIVQGQKKVNAQMSDQLRHLARDVSVQMGDVAVSLAGGMNPFMVMIQQGDQLRAAFQRVDATSQEVKDSMKVAAGMIAQSFYDTGKAVGTFFVGAIQSAGKQLMGLVTGPIKAYQEALYNVNAQTLTLKEKSNIAFGAIGASINAALPTLLIGLAIAIGSVAMAYKNLLTTERELSKSVILSGGAFNLTKESAVAFAQSMTGVGESTNTVVAAMTKVISAGDIASGSLGVVTRAALDLEKALGVSVEKTAEFYSKLSEKPTETLTKLAKETGKVETATLAMVAALEAQGRNAEAAALATQAAADTHRQMAESAISQMDPLQKLWLNMKSTIAEAGQYLYEFLKSDSVVQAFTTTWKSLVKVVGGFATILGAVIISVKTLGEYVSNVGNLGAFPEIFRRSGEELNKVFGNYINLVNGMENGVELAKLTGNELGKQANEQNKVASAILATVEYQKKQNEETAKNSLQISAAKKNFQILAAEAQKLVDVYNSSKQPEDFQKMNAMVDAANVAFKEVQRLEKEQVDELVKLWQDGEKAIAEERKKRAEEYQKIKNIEDRLVLQVTKSLNAQIKEQDKLTNAQKTYMDIIASEDYKKIGKDAKDRISQIFLEAHAREELNETIKLNQQEIEKLLKIQFAQDKALGDLWDKANSWDQALRDETSSLAFQTSIIGLNDEQRKRAIKTREAELVLEKELAEIRKSGASDSDRKTEEDAAYARFNKRMQNINTEIANDFAAKQVDEFNKVKSGISDAIVTALFEGGKAGRKKLRDVIVAELKKPITIFVKAIVENITGGITNSFMGTAGNAAGNAMSGGSGGFMDSMMGSIAGGATFSSMGSYFATGFMNTVAGTGTAAGVSAGAAVGGANGTAMALGAAAPWIAAALAIYAIYKSIDDSGTPHIGASASYSAAGGSRLGEGLYRLGSKQDSYSEDVAKGMESMAKSIVDMLDQTALTFGKTAGYEAAVAFADDSSKDGAWGALEISKLGDVIASFGSEGRGKWPGQLFGNGEQGIKEFNDAVAGQIKSTLLSMDLPEWAEAMLSKVGDTPTMENLAEAISKINGVQRAIQSLGDVMPAFANMTDETVTGLLNAFGSIENLSSFAGSYYQNFYSEADKIAATTTNLQKEFEKLGISMPADRLQYRVAVEKAMAEGNEELVAKLLMLSSSFASVTEAVTESSTEVDVVTDTLKNLRQESKQLEVDLLRLQGRTTEADAAARALATEGMTAIEIATYDANEVIRKQISDLTTKKSLEQELLKVQGNTAALRQMELDKLSPANQELQKLIWSLEDAAEAASIAQQAETALNNQRRSLEQQLFDLTATTAQKREKTLAELNDAESQRLQQLIWNTQDANTAAEAKARLDQQAYDLETQKLQLLGDTSKLRERELALLDPSLRAAKLEIWAIEDKIKADQEAARQAEEAARAQQQAAEEAARASQQLKDAWQSITDTIYEEVARIRNLATSGTTMSMSQAQYNLEIASTKARSGDQEAAKMLPELSKALIEIASQQATSSLELRRIQLYTAALLENTGNTLVGQYGLSIPQFASGGDYSGGLALVGEQGPELINFNSGGRVYNAATSASMLENGENIAGLISQLTQTVENLRYEVRAVATHTSKVAKILTNVTPEGDEIKVGFNTTQNVSIV